MKYKCSNCGKFHEEWPAIAFQTPHYYDILSEDDKKNIGEISEDFCIIRYEDQTDRFIRVVLNQKVLDHCEELQYGVWVTLSEKSFNDYKDNFKSLNHEAVYFGYLANQIPGYEKTLSIKTNVVATTGNNRPEIFPHKSDTGMNDFIIDYYNGITKEEAEKRIKLAIENSNT